VITKDGYRYEVTDKVVRAWKESQALSEPPVLLQDLDPTTGESFASDEEATAWIEAFIVEANLPPAPIEEEVPAEEPVVE